MYKFSFESNALSIKKGKMFVYLLEEEDGNTIYICVENVYFVIII